MNEEDDIVVLVVESEEEAEAIAFLKALVEKWILGVMNMGLDERRAWFVYEAARLAAEAAGAPIVPVPWSDREREFRDQFVGVIKRQCGESRSRSAAELHGDWMQTYFDMGWAYGEKYDREKKTHPDLVPYAELDQKERDKDEVFIALCEIARRWIGGGAG